ncbi:hypothetical protein [Streptomyces sp. uw30]|uniref:MmyB family transcriptional regulator n=1 Tax=Streptomyces sp. uw30 TaxID=1828179 RepID=UPI0021C89C46|nr:hypothetical protein [Streptomyces sp. uw30]
MFQHPEVGGITLDWDTYPLPGNPGPVLLVFTPEPGTADAERLQLLASLRATRDAASRQPSVGGVPSRPRMSEVRPRATARDRRPSPSQAPRRKMPRS